jgi:hypothetical protein
VTRVRSARREAVTRAQEAAGNFYRIGKSFRLPRPGGASRPQPACLRIPGWSGAFARAHLPARSLCRRHPNCPCFIPRIVRCRNTAATCGPRLERWDERNADCPPFRGPRVRRFLWCRRHLVGNFDACLLALGLLSKVCGHESDRGEGTGLRASDTGSQRRRLCSRPRGISTSHAPSGAQ